MLWLNIGLLHPVVFHRKDSVMQNLYKYCIACFIVIIVILLILIESDNSNRANLYKIFIMMPMLIVSTILFICIVSKDKTYQPLSGMDDEVMKKLRALLPLVEEIGIKEDGLRCVVIMYDKIMQVINGLEIPYDQDSEEEVHILAACNALQNEFILEVEQVCQNVLHFLRSRLVDLEKVCDARKIPRPVETNDIYDCGISLKDLERDWRNLPDLKYNEEEQFMHGLLSVQGWFDKVEKLRHELDRLEVASKAL